MLLSRNHVMTGSGVQISIRHLRSSKSTVVILAPGFFQSKETKTFLNLARDLNVHFDVIAMDFRGHGKSKGLYTFSAYEKEDLLAVIDYARGHYKKVGVLGFSYGGSIAIIEQVEFKNVNSLVCVSSPMASEEIEFEWWTPRAIKLGIKGLEPGAGVRPGNPFLKRIRPIDVVASVSPAPILFIHGTQDPAVQMRHSCMLYEKAKEPKALHVFEKGSHAEEIYRVHSGEFVGLVQSWFHKTLS